MNHLIAVLAIELRFAELRAAGKVPTFADVQAVLRELEAAKAVRS